MNVLRNVHCCPVCGGTGHAFCDRDKTEAGRLAFARIVELEAENSDFERGARGDRDEIEGLKAERDALRVELCNVIRQWSDDYMDLVGYPVDVTELSALAQAVWAAASTTA